LACAPSCGARSALDLAELAANGLGDASVGDPTLNGGGGHGAAGSVGRGGTQGFSGANGSGATGNAGRGTAGGASAMAGGPSDAGPPPTDASSDAGPIGCNADAGLVLEASGCVAVAAPRLQAPLSTSKVTSHAPTLHWLLAPNTDGAHVELCDTRQCSNPTMSFDADGASGAVPSALTPGVHYWRAFGRHDGVVGRTPSATWQFSVGHRSAPVDTSWGATFDTNGDGYADVILGAPDVGDGYAVPAGPGHAYVFMGSAAGLSSTPATTLTGPSRRNNAIPRQR
jgi:hypothetical protein